MSDNITQLDMEKRPSHGGIIRKILAIVLIAAVVLCVVSVILFGDGLNMDGLRRWIKYMNVKDSGEYGSYTFDAHSSNQYANFQNGLAVASVGGLNVYGEKGEELFVLQHQMELPQIQVHGDRILAYDAGGNDLLTLHRRSGETLHLEESRPILDADLSDSGFVCLSSSASGYKSVLSVYNPEQTLVYRWLSSTTYIPVCAVSPNGKYLAAIALGQKDGVYESSAYLFKTDAEDIQNKISLGSDLIYDLCFIDDNLLYAIGENSVQFISLAGEVIGTYSYEERYLKDFVDGGDGFLALSVNMYRAGNRYSLLTVDEDGTQLGATYIGQEILDMSACGRYVAVLTTDGLTIYTQTLDVYHQTQDTANATSVVMRADGSVILIGNGKGTLYIP